MSERREKTVRQRVIVEVVDGGFRTVEVLGAEVSIQKATTRVAQLQREEKKNGGSRVLELILR